MLCLQLNNGHPGPIIIKITNWSERNNIQNIQRKTNYKTEIKDRKRESENLRFTHIILSIYFSLNLNFRFGMV